MNPMLTTATLVALLGTHQAQKLCNPGWLRGEGKAPKICANDHPDYEAGLCYKECDTGYEGIGPVCLEKCKPEETDHGAFCYVAPEMADWYDRGAGTIPNDCGEGKEMEAGLCYTKCKPGYSGIGTLCFQDCPGGYKDSGNYIYCTRNIGDFFYKKTYGRGVGSPAECCPKGHEYIAGLCYPVPKNGYSCVEHHCRECGGAFGDCPDKPKSRGSGCGENEPPKPKPKPPQDDDDTRRLKGTHDRGVGIIPSICDNGWEKAIDLCHPKCGSGYFGDGTFCQSKNFRDNHFPSLEHSLPSVRDVMETCSLDLVVDTILSAKDFNNIQFGAKDMDKCLMENVNEQLDDQWDQQNAVTAIEIAMEVAADGDGLLQHVMSLRDMEFAEYGDFKKSCSKHGNADALDKFDDFLRWFYDEVKMKDRENVYVGIAFEPMPKNDQPTQPAGSYDKGLGVYFYYGACEGGKVSIGSNIVVYQSLFDITSKRQSYAPFTELKPGDKINVNSMYGLSENGCSLNYMGVSLDSKETKDWFGWDGHECKAEGILRLN